MTHQRANTFTAANQLLSEMPHLNSKPHPAFHAPPRPEAATASDIRPKI